MGVLWDKRKGKEGKPERGIPGWYYRWTFKGVRYEEWGFDKKKDAMEALENAKRTARGLAPKRPTTSINLRKAATEYFKQCEVSCTKNHFQAQRYRYNKWFADLSDMPCSKITPALIKSQMQKWAKAQSPHTANVNLKFLKSILTHAAEIELIPVNPILHVKKLPVEKKKKYVPPREDVLAVYLKCSKRDRCMIDVYLGTLARKRELFDLTWDSVFFKERYLILSTRKSSGGNLKRSPYPMTTEVYNALKWVKKNRLSSQWVFPSPRTGEPYYDRNKWFLRLCEDAGVKHFSLHSLRHYSSNLAAIRGATTREAQQFCRHDNMTTTNTYLKEIAPPNWDSIKLLEDPLGIKSKGPGRKVSADHLQTES